MSDLNGIARFAACIIEALVDDPAAVRVEERSGGSAILLEVHVGPPYVGQVIGKHGRNLTAVRTILSAYGAKEGRRVFLELVEPEAARGEPLGRSRRL